MIVGIIESHQLPVVIAAYMHLLSLAMHTVSYTDAEDPERRSRVDLEAWSRQGCNLRLQTPLDAGNNACGRLWGVILALVTAIPESPSHHREFADLIMQACCRFESLGQGNLIKQGDMIESLL